MIANAVISWILPWRGLAGCGLFPMTSPEKS